VGADNDRVIVVAVGQATLHNGTRSLNDVEVRQGVAVLADKYAGAASLTAGSKHGHDRARHFLDDGDAPGLVLLDALVHVPRGSARQTDQAHQAARKRDGKGDAGEIVQTHGVSFALVTSHY